MLPELCIHHLAVSNQFHIMTTKVLLSESDSKIIQLSNSKQTLLNSANIRQYIYLTPSIALLTYFTKQLVIFHRTHLCILHLEIIIWDPMFLGDICSAQNSTTFELCLSISSVVITIYRSKGSNTSHINHIGILGSWPHGISHSYQIWYLGLHTNSKYENLKLSWSVCSIRTLRATDFKLCT